MSTVDAAETTETKIEATQRLRAEGLWDEASEFRAEQREKFKAEGLTKKEAREKSWEAMLEEYPASSEPAEQPEPEPQPEEVLFPNTEEILRAKSKSTDFDADFLWAYQHIGIVRVRPEEAPNASAYFLWQYGRSAMAKFLDTALKHFTSKTKDEKRESQVFIDDKREMFSLLDEFQDWKEADIEFKKCLSELEASQESGDIEAAKAAIGGALEYISSFVDR